MARTSLCACNLEDSAKELFEINHEFSSHKVFSLISLTKGIDTTIDTSFLTSYSKQNLSFELLTNGT